MTPPTHRYVDDDVDVDARRGARRARANTASTPRGATKTIGKSTPHRRRAMTPVSAATAGRRGTTSATPVGARANARARAVRGAGGDDYDAIFDLRASARGDDVATSTSRRQETDPHKIKQRQRQIDYGKNTLGYARYRELVDRAMRKPSDAWTPDVRAAASKRAFDGLVRKWRRALHAYDPPVDENDDGAIVNVPVDPTTRPEGSLKPGEYVPEALARAARARADAKAAADAAVRENRHVPLPKLPPLRAPDFTPSALPKRADMPPGWDALTPDAARDARDGAERMDVDGVARSIYDAGWEGDDFNGIV